MSLKTTLRKVRRISSAQRLSQLSITRTARLCTAFDNTILSPFVSTKDTSRGVASEELSTHIKWISARLVVSDPDSMTLQQRRATCT